MPDHVIEVRNFRKTYGDFVAVKDISFNVKRGEIFRLTRSQWRRKDQHPGELGGSRAPNGGTLRVVGIDPIQDPHKLRNVIGVQLQSSALPESITVKEVMVFFSAYHGVTPRYDLLDRLGLGEK